MGKNTIWVNNTIWQVSHYLVIVIHLIMFIAGIATYVVNGQNLSQISGLQSLNADLKSKTIVWAVGGVVSSVPPPPLSHSPKVLILINLFIQGIAGLVCTPPIFWRLLYLQRESPAGTVQEAYYLKRKIAYISSIILQGSLVIADIASGAAVVGTISVYGNLAAPVASAFIAA